MFLLIPSLKVNLQRKFKYLLLTETITSGQVQFQYLTSFLGKHYMVKTFQVFQPRMMMVATKAKSQSTVLVLLPFQ